MQTIQPEYVETLQREMAIKQRAHISRVFAEAKRTLELIAFLEAEDFTVLAMEIGADRRTPIVHIKNVSRCGWLKKKHAAYTIGHRPGPYGRETIWRCDLFGCRAQWTERGN